MRRFYLAYQARLPNSQAGSTKSILGPPNEMKSQTPSTISTPVAPRTLPFVLSWSHYAFLIGINDPDERSFYEVEAARESWSLRELRRQFDSSLYERLALSRDKDGMRELARAGQVVEKPDDLLKDPYVLEFLGLEERPRYTESELESRIIDKLESFLLDSVGASCSRGASADSPSTTSTTTSISSSTTGYCVVSCSKT